MDFRELRKRAKKEGRDKRRDAELEADVDAPETDGAAVAEADADVETAEGGTDETLDTLAFGEFDASEADAAEADTAEPEHEGEAADGDDDEYDADEVWEADWDELDPGEEILRLRLGRELFALYLDEIEEIIKPKPFTWVPRTPAWILGLLSLRGTMIPVVDLRLRLGLSAERSATARIVVVTHDEEPCGLLVDEVRNVESVRPETIEAIPAALHDAAGRFLQGLVRSGGELVALIDLDSVLAMEGEGYERVG